MKRLYLALRHRSPQGNRHLRRLLQQVANAGARTKGSIFAVVYRPMVPRLGHHPTVGALAHRQGRLIWLMRHEAERYQERGSGLSQRSKQLRTWKMIRERRTRGYRIEPPGSGPHQLSG